MSSLIPSKGRRHSFRQNEEVILICSIYELAFRWEDFDGFPFLASKFVLDALEVSPVSNRTPVVVPDA